MMKRIFILCAVLLNLNFLTASLAHSQVAPIEKDLPVLKISDEDIEQAKTPPAIQESAAGMESQSSAAAAVKSEADRQSTEKKSVGEFEREAAKGIEKNQAESQIAVFKKSEEAKAAPTESPFYKILLTLFVLGLVCGVSVLALKRWSRRGQKANDPHRIKILSQHHLGPKKSLAIIRVAGETILIGVTDQNISLIKALSLMDEELPDHVPQSFDRELQNSSEEDDQEIQDNFALAGLQDVKDRVSKKLSQMRI